MAGRSLAAIAQPQDFFMPRAGWLSLSRLVRASRFGLSQIMSFNSSLGHADCCVAEKFKDLSYPEILASVIL
jgi:hypothetical protein